MRYLLLIGISLLVACKQAPPKAPDIVVKAYTVIAKTIPANFTFVGVAKSSHPVEIRARVEGYLWSIDYVEGSRVQQNDLLFGLDPREFEAKLVAAKAILSRQEAVLWRAKASYDRIKPLYELNAASKRDLDDVTAEVLTAEAEVLQAQANVFEAELNLSYTRITSPINGLAGKAIYREGTLITPSVNGLLTQVLVIDPIWIYFPVTDNQLLVGRAEQSHDRLIIPEEQEYTVTLTLADGSLFPHKGRVNFTAPDLNPETGTLTVRATFPNPEGIILPGQFVSATVTGARRPHALLVPQTAVFQGEKGLYVWVINENFTVTQRFIEVGDAYEQDWIVHSGLQTGEKIVCEGVNKLHPGSMVRLAQ